MSVPGLNKRKNDGPSNTYSSFSMTFIVLLVCAACGGAAILYGIDSVSSKLPTSRLTYISGGVTYSLNLQTRESVSMGMMQDPFYASPLSPDHQWIATWEISTQNQSSIAIVDAASQQSVYRHRIDSSGSRLSWSLDSQWLVLSARAPEDDRNTSDLWVLHHATGLMKRLSQTPQMEIDPTFSPDGTRIAYITIEDSGEHHLYVMDAATGESRLLTSEQNADRPSWSPDGRWIAFEASTDGTMPHIEVIHPDGTNQHAVTPLDIHAHTPLWVP